MGFLIRIILWAILLYFLYQFIRSIFAGKNTLNERSGNTNQKVYGGAPSKPPLDLSHRDVEEAVYQDVTEDKKHK